MRLGIRVKKNKVVLEDDNNQYTVNELIVIIMNSVESLKNI